MTPAIEIENLSFRYDKPLILENINLTVEAGEFLGIVGPNGSGKSTLLKIIMGILRPQDGDIRVLGKNPVQAHQEIGYMPQFTQFTKDFPINVEEAVLLGRLGKTRMFGFYSKKDRHIAQRVMEELEILDLKKEPIGNLSGGQLQRVLIARALASKPKILILDEPTANIDMRVEKDVFELLKRLNKDVTIIVVSHDLGFISQYIRRVACINRTLACHETSNVSGEIIQDLYGHPVNVVFHDHKHH